MLIRLRRPTRSKPLRGLIAALIFVSLIGSIAGATGSHGTVVSPQVNEKTLVCVVSGESVDPVVFVERGKLLQPYLEEKEKERSLFANEYFKAGRKYRLTFGGGDQGTATITKWDTGCNNVHAVAELKTAAKLGGRVMALATNSETLGHKPAARRAPTTAERAALMAVVKRVYRAKGAAASLLPRITTTNLTATDLDGDGQYEFVGSFVIATPNKFRRDLFLITESEASGYKEALVEYQSYKLPPEGFASAIDFVDQLDLDGDNVGEVFTIQGGFDAYGYAIYKRQKLRWRKVYSFVGDAC